MAAADLEQIVFSYPGGTEVLRGVSLIFEEGSGTAIVGQNGAGKTTLLKMVNGLLRPSAGRVRLWGEDIQGKSTARISRQVGFVFQNPRTQIFLGSVQEEAAFGPRQIGMTREEIERRVRQALELCGLGVARSRHPYDLTPGDRKLLAIASIIAMDPRLLILDEPTGGLDSRSYERVCQVVETYLAEGRTVIAATHDMDFAARCFSRVAVMTGGRITAEGPTPEVFSQHEQLAAAHLEPTAISLLAATCGLPRRLLTVDVMANYLENKKV